MKVVILAGGRGTRISEVTNRRPKPMVEIGGKPILWHIMKIYSQYGLTDFVICLGHLGYVIKEYFANYFLHMSDVTFHMRENRMEVHEQHCEPWTVTLVDTGSDTMTGGRLLRVRKYVDGTFCFTYGDGLSDVNIDQLIAFHNQHGKLATVTSIQPPGRYGALSEKDGLITQFDEKPRGDGGWINGGFFVLEPAVLTPLKGDASVWEHDGLEHLVARREIMAFRHNGFWHGMDTERDHQQLEKLWETGAAPWKGWE